MDIDAFLALEKRRLAEERQRLYEQALELNSSRTSDTTPTTTSMVKEHENQQKPNEEITILNKKTKDWINKQHNNKTNNEDANEAPSSNRPKKKSPDDMEQWVSDTFYSYFPGFSNEYQKRQNELQKRQLENQENLIKHQLLHSRATRKNKQLNMETSNINSARSNNSSLTSNGAHGSLHTAAKTDLEIINVNNPNYVPSKHSANTVRPDSARYRLLQDLRHTNLTNLVNGSEDVLEINRKQAELESARKKEYQRELMQQIEEKRRTIKQLRDKEHQQEEVLTRRLQEQLKTMKLEEQLEKERIKAVKVRFDAEQNRLTREHLLAKLENDSQLLLNADLNALTIKKPTTLSQETNKENISHRPDNNNKVYKYFSNSEKHEYNYRNKSSSLPTEIDLELDQTEMAKIERECFHLSEKICPMCDEPLKELENFCLRCQTKLSFRIKSPSTGKTTTKHFINKNSKSTENESDKNSEPQETEAERSFFLESAKVNETAAQMSFHIMNDSRDSLRNDNKSSNIPSSSLSHEYSSLNNLDYTNHPPYSMNIEQNSVFHPDKQFSLFAPTEEENLKSPPENNLSFLNDKEQFLNVTNSDDDKNIEKLRRVTDKRLSRYLKNYGDLAYQTRGTQTTPTSTGRRDIVIQGEHSLSIPLMREMPKMTRMEAVKFKENSKELQDLQRRWDIPAVQKYTISPVSPKVVTQVGAIRKQLQIDRLFSEDADS
ncbi:probable E3 ubiquitin-protein ligase bre1 isoform X2 [Lucilia sericata]|uniref:probable E3 ubiquitin-protein ligase bre1 isoform X2 n=1 Tax=Lucilia sericata TaxID=13632 RepID=UPI0018A851DA|nr:probable E3 ubiquitin-protein ligase bre1 isoform X2 [Lucilia sericata]